jgi:uncharacterized protein YjbI with pentapeptide repeats
VPSLAPVLATTLARTNGPAAALTSANLSYAQLVLANLIAAKPAGELVVVYEYRPPTSTP